MKLILTMFAMLSLSACFETNHTDFGTLSTVLMSQPRTGVVIQKYKSEVYAEPEFYSDCVEYDMEECYD